MSIATEMADCILDAYLLALGGIDQCPECAPPEVKARLRVNIERAERAFSDAAAVGLSAGRSQLAPIVRQLFAANCASRQSLRNAEPIARLSYELERASHLSADVVAQAAKYSTHVDPDKLPNVSPQTAINSSSPKAHDI